MLSPLENVVERVVDVVVVTAFAAQLVPGNAIEASPFDIPEPTLQTFGSFGNPFSIKDYVNLSISLD